MPVLRRADVLGGTTLAAGPAGVFVGGRGFRAALSGLDNRERAPLALRRGDAHVLPGWEPGRHSPLASTKATEKHLRALKTRKPGNNPSAHPGVKG